MSDGNGTNPAASNGGNHYPPGAVVGAPFAKGVDTRRGHGLPGASGRKPQSYKDKFGKLFKRGFTEHSIVAILRNPNHPHFPKVLQIVLANWLGVPKQQVELSGSVNGPPALTVIVQQTGSNGATHPSTS